MHRIVKQALQRYSEDRIGMVDYALESGGVCAFTNSPYPGPYTGEAPGLPGSTVLSTQGLTPAQTRLPSKARVAEGSHEPEWTPGWEWLCETRLELRGGPEGLVPMLSKAGSSSLFPGRLFSPGTTT